MAAFIDNLCNENTSRFCSVERSSRCLISPLCRKSKLCTPSFSNLASCEPVCMIRDDMWITIRKEAESDIKQEPILLSYYQSLILSRTSLEDALAHHLAIKLSSSSAVSYDVLFQVFSQVFAEDKDIRKSIRDDLKAVRKRDPACISYVHCLLHFKGFQAIQAHRAAHKLWSTGRTAVSLLIQNRVSEIFGVDIHPGAKIGRGMHLDHATGVVIGETSVIGDNVTILHNVTLGGTGKDSNDRHPKIGNGVLLGAGSKVLGNIRIGDGVKIGAGSVVLKEVPPNTTAVGNPARFI